MPRARVAPPCGFRAFTGGSHVRKPLLSPVNAKGTHLALCPASHQGKECHVREQLRQIIEKTRRSSPRTGSIDASEISHAADGLGSELVRLARIAAAMHMADAAALLTQSRDDDNNSSIASSTPAITLPTNAGGPMSDALTSLAATLAIAEEAT